MASDTTTSGKTTYRTVDTSGRRRYSSDQSAIGRWWRKNGSPITALVAFLAIWQTYVNIAQPPEQLLPGPIAVGRELIRMQELGLLLPAFTASMHAYVVGTGMAVVVGLVLSISIGLSKLAQVVTMPYFWALFSMPRVALVPLFILWFGLGFQLTVAIVFASAVVPLVLQVLEGMRTAEGSLLKMSRLFCASRYETLFKVVLPASLPYMANGMRQCMSRGFVGLVVVEMLVGQRGLGVEAIRASLNFNTARVMAMIFVLIAVAVVLIVIARSIENSVSRWRETVAI